MNPKTRVFLPHRPASRPADAAKTLDKLAASIIVVALLAFFLWRSGRPDLNQPGAMPAGGGPEDSVRTMFASARDGRTADYLACFCESLRASLDDTARSMGDPKFREYIQGSAAPIMGMAFSDIAVRNATEAALRCELVFKDRNEVQRFTLKKTGSRWLISAMTPAERIQPPVKYGTKVFE